MAEVVEYVRTVAAFDPADAEGQVKSLANIDGLRVRTVKSVRLARLGDMPIRKPEYTVTLAVARA